MARGGARTISGPPPDPNALRRDRKSDRDGWTTLPAEGRKGPTPPWPLPPDIQLTAQLDVAEQKREMLEAQIEAGMHAKNGLARLAQLDQIIAVLRAQIARAEEMETALWAQLWSKPQAVAWEQLQMINNVAIYVRWQVRGELGDLKAAQEARQWDDRLGLNPSGMLRNRWKMEPSAKAAEAPAAPARGRSKTTKERLAGLTVIDGGA